MHFLIVRDQSAERYRHGISHDCRRYLICKAILHVLQCLCMCNGHVSHISLMYTGNVYILIYSKHDYPILDSTMREFEFFFYVQFKTIPYVYLIVEENSCLLFLTGIIFKLSVLINGDQYQSLNIV